ncbi:MAG: hypothetical protein ACYCUG_11615 [Acidimicrobiales bacterium]
MGPVAAEARRFARSLGERAGPAEGVLVVGAPSWEPWHFATHLAERAALGGRKDLRPTLLRWRVPPGSPPHLAVTVDDGLALASRTQTVLVVDPFGNSPQLLERLGDARSRGLRIMTIHRGSDDLVQLSHDTLSVDPCRPPRVFDLTQHVVTYAAGPPTA